jgi:hypothetical protein
VPRVVATTVATTPIRMLLPNAEQTSWALHTLIQLLSVNPRHEMLDLIELLNEKMNVYAIGISRKISASAV